MQNWWEIQGQMLDMWKETMDKMSSSKASGAPDEGTAKMMQTWIDSQKNMMEFWQKGMSQFTPWKMTAMHASPEMDTWQSWWEMQQKMLGYWQDAMKSWQSGEFFKSGEAKGWAMPTGDLYQEMMKRTAAGYRDFLKMIPTQIGQETFDKISQASDIYKSMLLFWENYAGNLPGKEDLEKWKEVSATWLENYNQILGDFFSMNLPEPFRSFMKSPAEMAGLYREVFFNFFQPWVDSSDKLQGKFMEAMQGDREAYLEFMRLWQEAFSSSYGKILHIPALGFSRESVERLNASLDSYMQYLTASNNFSAALYRSGNEVMDQLLLKIAELAEKGEAPETFSEFYELWWQTNEQAYFELFKTESFSKILGDTVDAWVKLKKRYDDLLDDYISSNFPVPTTKEMDTLYKTVYDMRKTIKKQAKMIKELQEILNKKDSSGGAEE